MIKLKIHLPNRYRVDFSLIKARQIPNQKPILPDLERIFRVKKGSHLSRFFRHIFEHRKIRKILGANFSLMIIASSFLPVQSSVFSTETDQTVVSQALEMIPTEKGTRYPVDEIRTTQGYKLYHPGIDFDGITGDSIYPAMSGTVEAVDFSKYAYGNAVLVTHGQGLTTLYAHLSKILVLKGQEVTPHMEIGKMGATGRSFGDHLHFEVRINGIPVNPSILLPSNTEVVSH